MWTERDQVFNNQIPVSDQKLIKDQYEQRVKNHSHSEKSKTPLRDPVPEATVKVGNLVYLWADGNKSHARECYLVTSEDGALLSVQKFVGNQLRNKKCQIHKSDCCKISQDCDNKHSELTMYLGNHDSDSSSEEDFDMQLILMYAVET